MRVIAVWRKDFIHVNKTRDNRAVYLGKKFNTTLVVRKDRSFGVHVRDSGARLVEIECSWPVFRVLEFYLRAFRYVRRSNKRKQFDLVYSFLGEEPVGYLMKVLFFRRAKWLVDLWDNPELIATRPLSIKRYVTKAYLWGLRLILHKADIVVAGVLPYALDKYNIPSERMIVVTNGIDLGKFDEKRTGKKQIEEKVRLLYVGHLMKDRGLDTLLDACKKMQQEIPDLFVLNLVGFSDEINPHWLNDKIKDNELSGVVNCIGELPAESIPKIISQSDICIHPFPDQLGLAEIYPIKVYEYLAMNKPVVASDLPGVRTIIKNQYNGFLFEPSSIESLKKQLLKLIVDSSERNQMGANARLSVKKYDWNIVLDDMFLRIKSHVENA